MSVSMAFRRTIIQTRSARTFSNVSRPGAIRPPFYLGNTLRLQRFQKSGNSINLNSRRAMSFHIDDDIIHEGLPDLDGRVREISYEILSKAKDAAKDHGIECAVKGLAHPNFGDHWVILDEAGDMILLWKDIAHGALLEHYASAERQEKEGRIISLVATKLGLLMEKCGIKVGVVHDGEQMLIVQVGSEPYNGVAPSIKFGPPISVDAKVEGRPICEGCIRYFMLYGRKGVDAFVEFED